MDSRELEGGLSQLWSRSVPLPSGKTVSSWSLLVFELDRFEGADEEFVDFAGRSWEDSERSECLWKAMGEYL